MTNKKMHLPIKEILIDIEYFNYSFS